MTSPVENIPRKGSLTPQISPLRSFGAPVELTKGRAALPATVVAGKAFFITLGGPTAHDFSGRKHSQERIADTADLSTALLRSSGRDDKGEGGASSDGSCWTGPIFHRPGRNTFPRKDP